MKIVSFKVFSLFTEINLNKMSTHFGIERKFAWDDFLSLKNQQLKGIIKEPESKTVNLFSFGSVVFINMEHHEIVDFVKYLINIDPNLKEPRYDYFEDYSLAHTDESETIKNDMMKVKNLQDYHVEILSHVLAKSVALEKVESDIQILLDEIEFAIKRLKSGSLNYRDNSLARTLARILTFKHDTISVIMILDKPDITWDNFDAEALYIKLSQLFELDERYVKLQAKTNTMMDILNVFTSLTQHKKSNTLEWMIIILIVIEIVISLVDFFLFKIN